MGNKFVWVEWRIGDWVKVDVGTGFTSFTGGEQLLEFKMDTAAA